MANDSEALENTKLLDEVFGSMEVSDDLLISESLLVVEMSLLDSGRLSEDDGEVIDAEPLEDAGEVAKDLEPPEVVGKLELPDAANDSDSEEDSMVASCVEILDSIVLL